MNKPTEKMIIANALRRIAMNWSALGHVRGPEAIHECANDLDPPSTWFEEGSETLLEIINKSRVTRGLTPLSAALAVEAGTDTRLYDGKAPMADGGDEKMTAAEEVLAWLLIEKIGVPDDVAYSPDDAQRIITARLSALTTSPASSGVKVKIDEEALDRAAREGYAVRCKTHGPRILAEYASQEIMDRQLADARVIVAAYLSAPSLSAGAGGEE